MSKVVKYEIGNTTATFTHQVHLITKDALQLRHNALESARLAANRYMTKESGREGFHLIVRVYPHQVLREHRLMSGAGADRFQSGMAHPYGKPMGIAARVRAGQEIYTIKVNEGSVIKAKEALKRASKKIPCHCAVRIEKQ